MLLSKSLQRPIKITHLCFKSRAAFGITQGIIANGWVPCLEDDYISKGKLIKEKSNNIFQDLLECDLIIMTDWVAYSDFISRNKLWNKVIFCDYRDNLGIQIEVKNKVAIYFKRSWFDSTRKKVVPSWVSPISHCALDEYYNFPINKDKNIGCFFDLNNHNIGIRRKNIVLELLNANFSNSLIGTSTAFGGGARLSIENKEENNHFYEFLNLQRRCKIIFTAQPEKVEGDNRTWEAFASGGLVFRDISYLPISNPTIDGTHCVVYDASNIESIQEAIEKARYFLDHEKERIEIANQGFDHVLKYHRPLNLVSTMIDTFRIRPKIF